MKHFIIFYLCWLTLLVSAASAEPRGISCIHCSHPKAEKSANSIANTLKESNVDSLSINFLLDDTFGFNPERVTEVCRTAVSNGAKLSVKLYPISGPGMRKAGRPGNNAWPKGVTPGKFRQKIKRDPKIRSGYLERLNRLVPLVGNLNSLNASVQVFPCGLEDNCDDETLKEVTSLYNSSNLAVMGAKLGRNPCPGCWQGSSSTIPNGWIRETHDVENLNARNCISINDGKDLSFQRHRKARDKAMRNHCEYLMWDSGRQGTDGGWKPHDQRVYKILNGQKRNEALRILRGQ